MSAVTPPAPPAIPITGGTFINSIGMEFVEIKPGAFLMGSLGGEEGRSAGEMPHRVKITKAFLLGVAPVTQGQWQAVMGNNPSNFQGDDARPQEMVSWDDAVKFCRALSLKEGRSYRLATEAEWEYACRAGTTTAYNTGDNEEALMEVGWYAENSGSRTNPVGRKKANAWGLYDMHGNVWEWCADWYRLYPDGEATDPTGPAEGMSRVLRGGSWCAHAASCRAAYRSATDPATRHNDIGFRVALDFPRDSQAATADPGPETGALLFAQAKVCEEGHGVEKDSAKALELYTRSANAGYAPAMIQLSSMYLYGIGAEPDEAEAVAWCRKAAEAGEPHGMSNLGVIYATGRSVVQDYVEAGKWYRKAAQAGHPGGMSNLGSMYASGRGVAQDYAEAMSWYRRAADVGEPIGMYNVGVIYANGCGVPQDDAQAGHWFRKAAEAGNALGMNSLGAMYESGRGVPQDDTEAVNWYRKAAALGERHAQDALRKRGLTW